MPSHLPTMPAGFLALRLALLGYAWLQSHPTHPLPPSPTLSHPYRPKVLIYSGQLDVIIGAALTERFLPGVAWHGQAAYKAAPKAVWRVKPSDTEVAGYARVVGNFSQVVVRAAGHIVPGDQPVRALDMISRFVEGRGYEHLPKWAPPDGRTFFQPFGSHPVGAVTRPVRISATPSVAQPSAADATGRVVKAIAYLGAQDLRRRRIDAPVHRRRDGQPSTPQSVVRVSTQLRRQVGATHAERQDTGLATPH